LVDFEMLDSGFYNSCCRWKHQQRRNNRKDFSLRSKWLWRFWGDKREENGGTPPFSSLLSTAN